MDPNSFPTKGNLILAQNSLALANQGYDLMDKKRNILIKELMNLMDEAAKVQEEIDITFSNAYKSLQKANIHMGLLNVEELSQTIPVDNSISIKRRSVMGTEIPYIESADKLKEPLYSFDNSKLSLDEAVYEFEKVKKLTLRLASIETAAFRLATNIKKTQKRANALKNITIPKFKSLAFDIQNSLEEKEREEFTRLKVIKRMKK